MVEIPDESNLPWTDVTIPNDLHAAAESEKHIVAQVERHGFSADETFAIRLAVEEALTNAIKHGNGGDPSTNVYIRFAVAAHVAVIHVRDEGPGFIVENVPDPTAPDRISLPNGRGIMLMRAYMDEISYHGNGNEVRMVKFKGSSPE